MFDFNSVLTSFARDMDWDNKCWFVGGVFELARMQDAGHQYYEGSKPTTPLFPMPEGYEMREWNDKAGKVIGNVIYVTNDRHLRPFIEAHELGHAWNHHEYGVEKGIDELQACLRGAEFIAAYHYDYALYWAYMWFYLRILGIQLTWNGYIFSYEPCQVNAAQFAWSVAVGDIKRATPMAIPLPD